ncbi:MAG: TIGR04551 family protein [Sandaracinaceae bacterium]|nr:TIGR04551 family protein [Sandaracinaceae bacterium]
MPRISLVILVVALSLVAAPGMAQPRPPARGQQQAPAATPDDAAEDEVEGEDEEEDDDTAGGLRAPTMEPPQLGELPPVEEEEGTEGDEPAEADPTEGEGDEALISPEDANSRLESEAPSSDPTDSSHWTAPQSVLTLHGYFRARGELQDTFYLGRAFQQGTSTPDLPFDMYHPAETRPGTTIDGGCGSTPGGGGCDTTSLQYATMRMRLQPQLNLSDDVRVHLWLDVFDNMVMGSTPDGSLVGGRSAFAPLQAFSGTALPPTYGLNSLGNSIIARRAWAEVRNRSLGELRFGRMGFHWGLGMLANAGDTFDSDYSTDVDRVLLITKLAGFYLMAAYDFASQGYGQHYTATDASGRTITDGSASYDPAQRDNVQQFFFAVARRSTPEDQATALSRGELVLNGGAFFVYRRQLLSSEYTGPTDGAPSTFVRRGFETFTPDLWGQLLWGSLRLEAEAALVLGSIENHQSTYAPTNQAVRQFGFSFEGEYRLFDDKFGLHLAAGFASGDSDAEGLGAFADTTSHQVGSSSSSSLSTFRFHPNYRVDLILWRSIMRQITGAYYFRPGVSYDFVRSPFGQLLGARADVVYSRASSPVQTWGNSVDLGVELDGSLYYRSEDGPEMIDGFYAMLQYGLLFPMQGLGYLEGQTVPGSDGKLKNAQTFRLILGVMF